MFFLFCKNPVHSEKILFVGELGNGDKRILLPLKHKDNVFYTFGESWWKITNELERRGITTTFRKSSEFGFFKRDYEEQYDLYIFLDCPTYLKRRAIRKHLNKSFLILSEPKSVIPSQYSDKLHKKFAKVFTWDDGLLHKLNVIKYCYPIYKIFQGGRSFTGRKLCCMMAGNKASTYQHELYSARLKIIRFFENINSTEFDLYGPGWNKNEHPRFVGYAKNKIEVLKTYKFNFCLENTKSSEGYVSEKIFDSFEAGAIPVYLGSSNIDKYIPRDCYIDYGNVSSEKVLYDFMHSFTQEDYEKYIKSIKKYLNSDQVNQFKVDSYVKIFLREILHFLRHTDDIEKWSS